MNTEYYQIGDLVYVDLRVFLDGEYLLAKVVAVDGEDNTVKVITCTGERENSFEFNMNKENMLTPIPLSEDLLEALGITDQSDNKIGDYRTDYLSVLMPGGLLMWNDFGIRKVKYLHELQHTMRGLGLPEIDYSKLLNYVNQ